MTFFKVNVQFSTVFKIKYTKTNTSESVNQITSYLPCEYVSLLLPGGIFAITCSTTSMKLPAHVAYFARTVEPLATTANNKGDLTVMKKVSLQCLT